MAPDTSLVLGTFQFDGVEVPEEIGFGGDQRLNVHELVGGVRKIDVMGESPSMIEWTGLFMGQGAIDRAKMIDGMRIDGLPLVLSMHDYMYSVLIRSFKYKFQRFYKAPYSISLEVISDLTRPAPLSSMGINQAINDDLDKSSGLAGLINESGLSSAMADIRSATSEIKDFAKATQSQLNQVIQPLVQARQQVGQLIQATNSAVSSVTTLGGILPGNPISKQASALINQTANVRKLTNLVSMNATLGSLTNNLGSIGK